MIDEVTALTVFYKTPELIEFALKPFREFYPDMKLIVVNNSPKNDLCTRQLTKLYFSDVRMELFHTQENLGHGFGLDYGLQRISTKYVYIFDSDAQMTKGGIIEEMLKKMTPEVYAMGFLMVTTPGGTGYILLKNFDENNPEQMLYIHPSSCLISRELYFKYSGFHSRGAPFSEAMYDLKLEGRARERLIEFGVRSYIKHGHGGTRAKFGMDEIPIKYRVIQKSI